MGCGGSEQGWTRQGNYAKMDLYEFHSGEAGAIKADTCVTNEQKTWSAKVGYGDGDDDDDGDDDGKGRG